jgi:hypothetical protein
MTPRALLLIQPAILIFGPFPQAGAFRIFILSLPTKRTLWQLSSRITTLHINLTKEMAFLVGRTVVFITDSAEGKSNSLDRILN